MSTIGLSSCGSSTVQVSTPPERTGGVYFSWGGNTRTVANEIFGNEEKSEEFDPQVNLGKIDCKLPDYVAVIMFLIELAQCCFF